MKEYVKKYIVAGAAAIVAMQVLKFLLNKVSGVLRKKMVPEDMDERLEEVEEVMRA